MIRISVFILKDDILLEKQRAIAVRTLVNQGYKPHEAESKAVELVSDVQCVFTTSTESNEVSPKVIARDVAGDKKYRTQVSSY